MMESVALLDYMLVHGLRAGCWEQLGEDKVLAVRHNHPRECEARYLHMCAMYSLFSQGKKRAVQVSFGAFRRAAVSSSHKQAGKPKQKRRRRKPVEDEDYNDHGNSANVSARVGELGKRNRARKSYVFDSFDEEESSEESSSEEEPLWNLEKLLAVRERQVGRTPSITPA